MPRRRRGEFACWFLIAPVPTALLWVILLARLAGRKAKCRPFLPSSQQRVNQEIQSGPRTGNRAARRSQRTVVFRHSLEALPSACLLPPPGHGQNRRTYLPTRGVCGVLHA